MLVLASYLDLIDNANCNLTLGKLKSAVLFIKPMKPLPT